MDTMAGGGGGINSCWVGSDSGSSWPSSQGRLRLSPCTQSHKSSLQLLSGAHLPQGGRRAVCCYQRPSPGPLAKGVPEPPFGCPIPHQSQSPPEARLIAVSMGMYAL